MHRQLAVCSLAFVTVAAPSALAQSARRVTGVSPAPGPSVPVRPVYVDHLAASGGDGSSWQNAFDDLQDALLLTSAGDEIWVAEGLYTPSSNDATVSFVVPSGVRLFGGFAGNETSSAQRDWVLHQTVLSGDIGRDDIIGPGWPSGWNIVTSNSGHILDASGCDVTTLIDGFVIENGGTGPAGTPASSALRFGGGLYINTGSPTIRHCRFTHNSAGFGHGAAIYVNDGSPRIEACEVVENLTHAGGGGGMTAVGTGSVTVVDTSFVRNHVIATSVSLGSGDGAGIFSMLSGGLVLDGCTFEGNIARSFWPVGQELGHGGGVFAWTPVDARDCRFIRNTAHYGGGLMAWDDATVVNSFLYDNRAEVKPNDPFPEQGGYGAGLMVQSFGPAELRVVNTTIGFNRGKKFVGLHTMGTGAHASVENSILWGNVATHPEVIGYSRSQISGDWDATYSCIQYLFLGPAAGEDIPDPGDVPGSIDDDPLFVGPPSDLHLGFGSPCVDAANNGLVPLPIQADLDGNPRFVDDPAVADTGLGTAPIVDMGAYERQ